MSKLKVSAELTSGVSVECAIGEEKQIPVDGATRPILQQFSREEILSLLTDIE